MLLSNSGDLYSVATHMTPQQKAENIALLARVVMGWPILTPQEVPIAKDAWWRQYPRAVIYADGSLALITEIGTGPLHWDPYTSTADALEMLSKFDSWVVRKMQKRPGYSCDARRNDVNCSGYCQTETEAICAACLEWAQGEKGES